MSATPLVGLFGYTLAGITLGAAYRAVRTRTQQWASGSRYPELVVLGGLAARLAGLGGLVALISGGVGLAVLALLGGFLIPLLISDNAPTAPQGFHPGA
jgi:hypothetical protein